MPPRALIALLLLGPLVVAGCAETAPEPAPGVSATPAPTLPAPPTPEPPSGDPKLCPPEAPSREPSWRASFRMTGYYDSGPGIVATGARVFASAAGELRALDARSGAELWSTRAPHDDRADLAYPLLVPEHDVIVANGYYGARAFDAQTGARLWAAGAQPWGRGDAAGGVVAFGQPRPTLLDARTGEVLLAPDAPGGAVVALSRDATTLFAAGEQRVVAFDARTGDLLWNVTLEPDGHPLRPWRLVHDAASGALLVAGQTRSPAGDLVLALLALDDASGAPRWRHATEALADHDPLLLVVDEGEARALGTWSRYGHDAAYGTGGMAWETGSYGAFGVGVRLADGTRAYSWSLVQDTYGAVAYDPEADVAYALSEVVDWNDTAPPRAEGAQYRTLALDASSGAPLWCALEPLPGGGPGRERAVVGPDGALYVARPRDRYEPGETFPRDEIEVVAFRP